jgi:hypothetical protein
MPKTKAPKPPASTMKWDGSNPTQAVQWLMEFGGSAMLRPAEEAVETRAVETQDDDGNITVELVEVKITRPERIVYLRNGDNVTAVAGDTLQRSVPL